MAFRLISAYLVSLLALLNYCGIIGTGANEARSFSLAADSADAAARMLAGSPHAHAHASCTAAPIPAGAALAPQMRDEEEDDWDSWVPSSPPVSAFTPSTGLPSMVDLTLSDSPLVMQVVEDEVGGVGVGVDDGVSGGVDGAPRSEQAVFEAIAPTPSGIQVGQGVMVCDLWIDVEGAPDAHAVGAELRDCGPSLQVPPDMYLLMYCVTKEDRPRTEDSVVCRLGAGRDAYAAGLVEVVMRQRAIVSAPAHVPKQIWMHLVVAVRSVLDNQGRPCPSSFAGTCTPRTVPPGQELTLVSQWKDGPPPDPPTRRRQAPTTAGTAPQPPGAPAPAPAAPVSAPAAQPAWTSHAGAPSPRTAEHPRSPVGRAMSMSPPPSRYTAAYRQASPAEPSLRGFKRGPLPGMCGSLHPPTLLTGHAGSDLGLDAAAQAQVQAGAPSSLISTVWQHVAAHPAWLGAAVELRRMMMPAVLLAITAVGVVVMKVAMRCVLGSPCGSPQPKHHSSSAPGKTQAAAQAAAAAAARHAARRR